MWSSVSWSLFLKRDVAAEFSKCPFRSLRTPPVKFHLVPWDQRDDLHLLRRRSGKQNHPTISVSAGLRHVLNKRVNRHTQSIFPEHHCPVLGCWSLSWNFYISMSMWWRAHRERLERGGSFKNNVEGDWTKLLSQSDQSDFFPEPLGNSSMLPIGGR